MCEIVNLSIPQNLLPPTVLLACLALDVSDGSFCRCVSCWFLFHHCYSD